jgi:hypothetical protein
MAVAQGYGKTSSSGLIFSFDAADMVNSFKGKPGSNVLNGVFRIYDGYSLSTYSNGKLFETNGYTEVVNVPTLGTMTVESVEIYNVYSGYGEDGNYNCCPSLFRYHNSWRSIILQGNTNYTYEIVYKSDSGYTHPNYMYHYEYRSDGTYNTEFGVHDNSRRTALGDGWYHAWGSFTTQPTTADGSFGLWYYNYNTRDKISIAKISLQEGLSVLPPKQLIAPNTTRSATNALLNLAVDRSIDATNLSYSSTGEMLFDGVDDRLYIGSSTNYLPLQYHTLEAYVKTPGLGSGMNSCGIFGITYGLIVQILSGGRLSYYAYTTDSGSQVLLFGLESTGVNLFDNNWHHIVCTRDTNNVNVYIDGVLNITASNGGSWSGTNVWANMEALVGDNPNNVSYKFNGKINVAKIYNRALTPTEVLQNYRHYKNRSLI